MSTGITISEVNAITSHKYGFYVYNGSSFPASSGDLPGKYGSQVKRCSFDENAPMEGDISELPKNLDNQTAEGIAEIFNKIVQKYPGFYLDGNSNRVETQSLQIGNVQKAERDIIPSKPWIYLIGNPVKETSKGCSNLTIAA